MKNGEHAPQLAQTGLKTTVTNTRCSICRDKGEDRREAINRALSRGFSHKDIEAMTGIASRTIGNHSQHLPEIYREAKEKGVLNQAIDINTELREQLHFAKELRLSAREWLNDPTTGRVSFEPRASEVSVIYSDPLDVNNQGDPKKKKSNLQIMIDRIEGDKCESPIAIVAVDFRKVVFDALSATDTVIDKFAKIQGEYQKERQNEKDFEEVFNFAKWIRQFGTLEQVEEFLDRFPMFSEIDKSKVRARLEVTQIEGVQ